MLKKLILAFGVITLATSLTAPASAEVFVWTDPAYKINVSFPDNWMRQASLDDNLRLHILSPQGMDHAACRLYVTDDGRYKDAPPRANADISNFVFTPEQIQREVFKRPDTNAVSVSNYLQNAKLGRGAAVMAEVDFTKTWAGNQYPMHAMVFASQYHGKNIVMSCETLASGWERWEPLLKGVFKSVDFPSAWTLEPHGHYRRFQDDGGVILPLNRKSNAINVR